MIINSKNLLIIVLTVIGQFANYHLTLNTLAASTAAPATAEAATSVNDITSQKLPQQEQQQQQQQQHDVTNTTITTTEQPTNLPVRDAAATLNEINAKQEQLQQHQQAVEEADIDPKQLESSVIQMIPHTHVKHSINKHHNIYSNNGNNWNNSINGKFPLLDKNVNINPENLNKTLINHFNVNQTKVEFKSNSSAFGEMGNITKQFINNNATTIANNKNHNKSENEIDSFDNYLNQQKFYDVTTESISKTKSTTAILTTTEVDVGVKAAAATTAAATMKTTVSFYDLSKETNNSSGTEEIVATTAATVVATITTIATPITTLGDILKTTPIPITNFAATTTTALPHLMKMSKFVRPVLENFTIIRNNDESEEMKSSVIPTIVTIATTEAAVAEPTPVTNHIDIKKSNYKVDDDDDVENFVKSTTQWPSNDYTPTTIPETTMKIITTEEGEVAPTTTNEINAEYFQVTERTNDFLKDETSTSTTTAAALTTTTATTRTTSTTPTTTATAATSLQATQMQNGEFIGTTTASLAQETGKTTTTTMATPTTTIMAATKATTTTTNILDNLQNNLITTEENLQKPEFKASTQSTIRDVRSTTAEIFDNLTTTEHIDLNGLKESEMNLTETTTMTSRSRRILETFNNVPNNVQIREGKIPGDSSSFDSDNNNVATNVMSLSTTPINGIEVYETTTAISATAATTTEYITTEWPDMEYSTVTVPITTTTTRITRSRNLPPSKLEHSRNSDGVEMFYGYSVVAHNQ